MGKVKKNILFFVSFVKINLSINLKCFTFYKGLDLVQKLKSERTFYLMCAHTHTHSIAEPFQWGKIYACDKLVCFQSLTVVSVL